MNKDRKDDNNGEEGIRDLFNVTKRGGWLWWFWLFFFENPRDRARPRQVAVLWSTKNDAKLMCNGVHMGTADPYGEDGFVDGGIAAWYYDGTTMHHNFLLERVKMEVDESGIATLSPDTAFRVNDGAFQISVSEAMTFEATVLEGANEFVSPWVKQHKYLGYGYEMTGINRLDLKASIDGETSMGTGYFQKVFLTAPAAPWYWGIFHFENNACLSYFNPHLLGRSLKKDVSFHDGRALHKFKDIRVRKTPGKLPVFNVSAKNAEESVEFSVEPYSGTVWSFRKKKGGLIPVKFDYRQYPARITMFRLKDRRNGVEISERETGIGVGNAEDSTGVLL